MDDATRASPLRGILDVEHFVKHQILDHTARNLERIQQPADGDAVVGRIVMTEAGARTFRTPSHAGRRKLAVEEAPIQVLKNLLQIEAAALRRPLPLVPTLAAGFLDATAAAVIEDIGQVTLASFSRGPLVENFGQQDFGQRFKHDGRRVLEQV